MPQKKLIKIFTLTELLISEIDFAGSEPTETTKVLLDHLNKTQTILEEISNGFYSNKEVRGSAKFVELQNKIDYVINKVYK